MIGGGQAMHGGSYGGGYGGGVVGGGYGGGAMGGAMIAGAGGRGMAVARGPQGNTCCVAQGEDCTACGVGCGGSGTGALAYVGTGQGDYIQETTYRYVGCGGDFARPRRDFTCIIITGSVLGLLLLIPLLLWLMAGAAEIYDCRAAPGFNPDLWGSAQKDYCCRTAGVGCATTRPVTAPPTPPPTPPPTVTNPNIRPAPITLPPTLRPILPPVRPIAPLPPADPYNCAVGTYPTWQQPKQQWCCDNHHICSAQTSAPQPADPYNCADGFANWQAGWSIGKKEWCCRVHGKGCPNQGGGGWSIGKKEWCCRVHG